MFCYWANTALRKIRNKSPIYFKYVIQLKHVFLDSVWILQCLTFLWTPLHAAYDESIKPKFSLKIGTHCEVLCDWSGHCTQWASPLIQTYFTLEFSAAKSHPFTNCVQLCSSENVTQKFYFKAFPSFTLPCWPEVHEDHPHICFNPFNI